MAVTRFINQGHVHTIPEKFENGVFTLKAHHIFSIHIAPEKFENPTIAESRNTSPVPKFPFPVRHVRVELRHEKKRVQDILTSSFQFQKDEGSYRPIFKVEMGFVS